MIKKLYLRKRFPQRNTHNDVPVTSSNSSIFHLDRYRKSLTGNSQNKRKNKDNNPELFQSLLFLPVHSVSHNFGTTLFCSQYPQITPPHPPTTTKKIPTPFFWRECSLFIPPKNPLNPQLFFFFPTSRTHQKRCPQIRDLNKPTSSKTQRSVIWAIAYK